MICTEVKFIVLLNKKIEIPLLPLSLGSFSYIAIHQGVHLLELSVVKQHSSFNLLLGKKHYLIQ